MNIIICQ